MQHDDKYCILFATRTPKIDSRPDKISSGFCLQNLGVRLSLIAFLYWLEVVNSKVMLETWLYAQIMKVLCMYMSLSMVSADFDQFLAVNLSKMTRISIFQKMGK